MPLLAKLSGIQADVARLIEQSGRWSLVTRALLNAFVQPSPKLGVHMLCKDSHMEALEVALRQVQYMDSDPRVWQTIKHFNNVDLTRDTADISVEMPSLTDVDVGRKVDCESESESEIEDEEVEEEEEQEELISVKAGSKRKAPAKANSPVKRRATAKAAAPVAAPAPTKTKAAAKPKTAAATRRSQRNVK